MALAVERIEATISPEPEHDLAEYLRDCTTELSHQNRELLHDRYRLEPGTK